MGTHDNIGVFFQVLCIVATFSADEVSTFKIGDENPSPSTLGFVWTLIMTHTLGVGTYTLCGTVSATCGTESSRQIAYKHFEKLHHNPCYPTREVDEKRYNTNGNPDPSWTQHKLARKMELEVNEVERHLCRGKMRRCCRFVKR